MSKYDIERITSYIDALHDHETIDEEDFIRLIDPIFESCLTRKHYSFRANVQEDLHQEVRLWLLRMIRGEIKLPTHSYITWLHFCIDKLISRWCQENLADVPIGNLIVEDYFPDLREEENYD